MAQTVTPLHVCVVCCVPRMLNDFTSNFALSVRYAVPLPIYDDNGALACKVKMGYKQCVFVLLFVNMEACPLFRIIPPY